MTIPASLGIPLVLAAAAVTWITIWALQRRALVKPETGRKLLHIATGTLGLSFLWIFQNTWPVIALVLITILGLAAIRLSRSAREGVGSVLHGVGRTSWGEFYLPASIGILWIVARAEPILYAVPILIVTFADAVAALVGVEYGRHRFDAVDGRKSTEGSFVCFVVAFFCTHVPLLVFTDAGRVETLLISAIVGFTVMLVEASAWSGLDNLFIPLFGFLLLRALLELGPGTLWGQLWLAAGLGLLVVIMGRFTTLRGGALFGAVLVGYLFWTIGGVHWVWPPLLVFLAYALLPPRTPLDHSRTHNSLVLFSVCSAGLAWLIASHLLERPDFLYPFTVAFAAHLGLISAVRWRWARSAMADGAVVFASTLAAAAIILVPYVLLGGMGLDRWLEATLGLAAIVVGVAGFQLSRRNIADPLPPGYRWGREAFWAGLASLLAVLPFLAWGPAIA